MRNYVNSCVKYSLKLHQVLMDLDLFHMHVTYTLHVMIDISHVLITHVYYMRNIMILHAKFPCLNRALRM